jgi:outer membrane protein
MKKTILGLLVFLLALSSVSLLAQAKSSSTSLSIALVDIEAIVKEMPEALAADKELADFINLIQDSVNAKRKDIETRFQNYQKQKAMMPAANQQQEEEKFSLEAQELQTYSNEKQNEHSRLREKLLEPIRAKVKAAIEAVAKEEKISMVLSKEASLVLYADSKLDITFRVIDKIKREK